MRQKLFYACCSTAMGDGCREADHPNLKPCAGGFTLLEILVSLSIISVVLLSVYRVHSQTITMSREAGFYATAPFLANAKMAEIDAAIPEPAQEGTGDFGDDYPDYHWTVEISDVLSEALGETADDLKQIDITVLFDEGKRKFHLRAFRLFR